MKFREGCAGQIKIPEGKRDVIVFDDELPVFGIRRFVSGRASYIVKYEVGTKQRRLTLGKVIKGNLADMRKQASLILSKARIGLDTVGEKRAAADAAARLEGTTLAKPIPAYLKARQPGLRPRYYAELKRQLEVDCRSLHPLAAASVTRQAVIGVMDGMAKRGASVAADRARMALSGFFGWCIEQGYADHNPTSNITPRGQGGERDRRLKPDELVEIWRACDGDDYGRIVKLLILTGQRRGEIASLIGPRSTKTRNRSICRLSAPKIIAPTSSR